MHCHDGQASGFIGGMLLVLWMGLPFLSSAQTVSVTHGQTIAFLGDSITAEGGRPGGYCRLVISGLESVGVKADMIPAGNSGDKSNDMLRRLENDVLRKKPAWLTLSCGVNDVWHGARGVALEAYKTNITAIVDAAQTQGIKVMILTATMISENPADGNNQKLAAYNDFLRALAVEKKCLLADLNADMQKAVAAGRAKGQQGDVLTRDGVHMNALGNQMMAIGILRAFGLNEEQINDIPGMVGVPVLASLSLRQQTRLQALADVRKTTLSKIIKSELDKCVENLLKE